MYEVWVQNPATSSNKTITGLVSRASKKIDNGAYMSKQPEPSLVAIKGDAKNNLADKERKQAEKGRHPTGGWLRQR